MDKRIVILGGGTGGTLLANRLRRRFDDEYLQIDVVDRDDVHVYQPGMLFVPFGLADPDEIVRPRRRQLHKGIGFHQVEIESVALDAERVHLADGSSLPYDVLVVASGAQLQPEETEGCSEPAGTRRRSPSTSSTARRSCATRSPASRAGGSSSTSPTCRSSARSRRSSSRSSPTGSCARAACASDSEIVLATPLDGCFTKPIAVEAPDAPARREGDPARGRVQRGRGRRRRAQARLVRRPRDPVRPSVDRPAARRRRVRRPLRGARRRARLRPDRPGDAPGARRAERVRHRRRDRPAELEGRLGDALRGRDPHARTSSGSSPAASSPRDSTATRTASSRPDSTRRC